MSHRIQKWLQYALIAALLAGSGGQWLVLQSVAWTGMFVRFYQEENVVLALEKTFDKANACSLCDHISNAEPQSSANDDRVPHGERLLGILCPNEESALSPLTGQIEFPRPLTLQALDALPPGTPPPRA